MTHSALSGAALIEAYREEPLLALPDGVLSRRAGYVPMLVGYTREDKEAKGLRKLADPDLPRPPVHFTAVEATVMDHALLLTAPHGGGKTSFALDLALSLAGEALGDPDFHRARLDRLVPRNDLGTTEAEEWQGPLPRPLYVFADPALDAKALEALLAPHLEDSSPLLLILDNAERLGRDGAALVAAAATWLERFPRLRLLILGEETVCRAWPLPEGFASHALLPLLDAQKADFIARHTTVDNKKPTTPALPQAFFLSLAVDAPAESVDALVLASAQAAFPDDRIGLDRAAALGFAAWRGDRPRRHAQASALEPLVLTARHLATLRVDAILDLFRAQPDRWALPIGRLAARGTDVRALAIGLARSSDRGAVLAADFLVASDDQAGWDVVLPALVDAIAGNELPVALRDQAGRHLARRGDPRDLEELVSVPTLRLVMGSRTHPNSIPVHVVDVASFRIGRFPVTNRLYVAFVAETERPWRSPDGQEAERSNAPAVDLSWYDARAFCDWLTIGWRATGRIDGDEHVRLPTEAEWEAAARGSEPDRADAIVYPWAGGWRDTLANSAEAGFNDTCAVGLFPGGRSAAGADDMTGQVWEWTTTLWGRDPATPEISYPYKAEDREDPDAPADVRRVLRGGCFSSNRLKACCTYRGSLEPDGYWRGNGFRIVVSR